MCGILEGETKNLSINILPLTAVSQCIMKEMVSYGGDGVLPKKLVVDVQHASQIPNPV